MCIGTGTCMCMYVQVCMVRDEKNTLGTLLHSSPYYYREAESITECVAHCVLARLSDGKVPSENFQAL